MKRLTCELKKPQTRLWTVILAAFILSIIWVSLSTTNSSPAWADSPTPNNLIEFCEDIPFWVDHRPVAVLQLFNGSWPEVVSDGNEWGLNRRWKSGGVSYLIEQLNILYEKGYRRFMLSLPAGRANLGRVSWPSAQWHVLDTAGIATESGSVRTDLADDLTLWLAERPNAQIIIYQGFRIDSPYSRDMTYAHPPDLEDQADVGVVRENTQGWLSLSPDPNRPQIGFGFDNSGPWPDELVSLAEYFFERGVWVTGEAIPRDHQGQPDPAVIFRAPWFGLFQYHQAVDPTGSWEVDPIRTHLGYAVHNRELTPDNRDLTEEEIHDAIRSAHERGFVIFVYGHKHTDFVLRITALDVLPYVVCTLPDDVLKSPGPGNKTSFLNILDDIRRDTAAGNIEIAIKRLENLKKRVDGCSESQGQMSDADDWVLDCADQREIRSLIDLSINHLINDPLDFREVASLSTQNAYPPYDPFANWRSLNGIRSQCVAANVWTMSGFALHANHGDTLEDFLAYPREQIKRRLNGYLDDNPQLSRDTRDLVVLDMEFPVGPADFGQYLGSSQFDEVIEAFKLRIEVAREMLPHAKLSLFGVVVPHGQANASNPGFVTRIEGYRRAAELGLYDQLDYLSPALYVRWGPTDPRFNTIEAYTRMGIEFTESLPNSRPLAPFLSLRVANSNSNHDAEFVPLHVAKAQLAYLQEHPSVERIVYWVPPKPDNPRYTSASEIRDFFRNLNPCGR